MRILKNKRIPLVRVLRRSSKIKEETWKREYKIKEKYPHLFSNIGMLNSEDEISNRMRENVNLERYMLA